MSLHITPARSRARVTVAVCIVIAFIGLLGFSTVAVVKNIQYQGDSSQIASGQTQTSLPARPTIFNNKIEAEAATQLRSFGDWLEVNNTKGYIGELGWPSTKPDNTEWNKVADTWYREAAYHDLWVTAWAAGSWWGDYPLGIYDHLGHDRGLDTADTQASVIEAYTTTGTQLRGINLAGMEFGTDKSTFNNVNRGVPGQDYFYEPTDSYAFLAKHGITVVRLPFRWERIQPQLGDELDAHEIQAIKEQLDAAQANGIKVILDLHNYGAYQTTNGQLLLGDGKLTHQHLVDVWQKLSKAVGKHSAIAAYDIMNEPHDLPTGNQQTPAKNWETASQAVVTALRSDGNNTTLMIAGYDWSSLARWQQNHPTAWITDPANNFRYEAHHYWDSDGSGLYKMSFADELKQR